MLSGKAPTNLRHSESLHVIRQVAHPIFIPLALPVAQPPEPILAPPDNVEILTAQTLQTVLEVQNGPGVRAGDGATFLAVLVPGPAVVCPHHGLEKLLGIGVEVGDRFSLGSNGSKL